MHSTFSSPIPALSIRGLSFDVEVVSTGPRVHTQSRWRFLRPATGVAGQVSLSSSSEDSRFSPVRGDDFVPFLVVVTIFAPDLRALPSPSTSSLLVSGGESSRVEMVETEDSMSEWRIVYFSLMMSSVSGAAKATFFDVGNIGLDCANILRCVAGFGNGLLVRIDVALYVSLYGTDVGNESVVEMELAEVVLDAVESRLSKATGEDEMMSCEVMLEVARFDRVGRLGLLPAALNLASSSCALLKVLRTVGEVAERVSNRRLVVFLPKVGGKMDVLSDNLGRFEGEGATDSVGVWL